MKYEFPPWVVLVVMGALVFMLLDLHFTTAWESLYAPEPWAGMEQAARTGVLEPWFGSTPRSLRVTQTVLGGLAFVVGLVRTDDPWNAGMALWIGVLIPLIPVLVGRTILNETGLLVVTPMSEEPLTWLALPLEAVRVGAPILAGVLASRLLLGFRRLIFGR